MKSDLSIWEDKPIYIIFDNKLNRNWNKQGNDDYFLSWNAAQKHADYLNSLDKTK